MILLFASLTSFMIAKSAAVINKLFTVSFAIVRNACE